MNVGMLWFDNDPKSNLDAKISRAATYYRDKYGRAPTLCFVHPSMLGNGKVKDHNPENSQVNAESAKSFAACGVEIRSNLSILPHHIWIGVNGVS
jgi:hypothetical protein